MPLQNRVLPTGKIIAHPARGTLTGNRGIIHRPGRTLGAARWSHHAWICCTLDWQGRKRDVMTGRKWTELFFLDEAVAMAAGHRPCGYCRRAAYVAYAEAWARAHGGRPKAPEMDCALHAARIVKGTRRHQVFAEDIANVPPGAMILLEGTPHLVQAEALRPFHPEGYGSALSKPHGATVEVLTPRPNCAVLAHGYQPELHPTAAL